MKKILAIIVVCTLLCHTYRVVAIKPTFYLKNKGAQMPVTVRGNMHSCALIIFLHGGPGGTSMKKIGTRAFTSLEDKFGVVYWDQRGSDGASGGTQKEHMHLSQFIEDLDLLVDQLQNRYPRHKLFLMGHCWGGGLGTAYLTDSRRQSRITGWIDVAGAHNNPRSDSLSAEWVKSCARKKIRSGEDLEYWKKALRWYDANPHFPSNALGHYSFVRKLHGYQFAQGDSLGTFPGYTTAEIVRQPVRYASYYLNYYLTLNKFIISDIDLTPAMKNIYTPSLILWGKEDGLIPVQQAYEAYRSLGTPPASKRLIIFENTAHTIYYEQPTRFVIEVTDFIQAQLETPGLLVHATLKENPN